MHPSSIQNMAKVQNKYLRHIGVGSKVLDVGGRGSGRDRSYKSLFPGTTFYIADIQDGQNVTHVMPGPYTLPFESETFDLIVSGQMLEHCSNPFKSVAEMKRVLKKDGYLVLIAPSTGPRHDYQDGWRFLDDAFRFIVEDIGGVEIIADWIDRGPFMTNDRSSKWQDHVFVGKRIS